MSDELGNIVEYLFTRGCLAHEVAKITSLSTPAVRQMVAGKLATLESKRQKLAEVAIQKSGLANYLKDRRVRSVSTIPDSELLTLLFYRLYELGFSLAEITSLTGFSYKRLVKYTQDAVRLEKRRLYLQSIAEHVQGELAQMKAARRRALNNYFASVMECPETLPELNSRHIPRRDKPKSQTSLAAC